MKSASVHMNELLGCNDAEAYVLIEARDREVRAATLRKASNAIEGMIVGGRAWTADQELAARILRDVFMGLRDLAEKGAP